MRGDLMIWIGAVLLAAPVSEAAAGPTAYSGPLPPLVAEVAFQSRPGPSTPSAAGGRDESAWSGPVLDLAAAAKLGGLPGHGCDLQEAVPRLHVATNTGPN